MKRSLKSSVVDSSSPADPVSEMRVLSSVGVSGMPSPSHGLQPGHSGRPVSMYEARDSLRVQVLCFTLSNILNRRNLKQVLKELEVHGLKKIFKKKMAFY